MIEVLQHMLRIMCVNWAYLNKPDFEQKDKSEYIKYRFEYSNKVLNHPLFNELVAPLLIGCRIEESGSDLKERFDIIQPQVFKILDIIDKNERIDEDFK